MTIEFKMNAGYDDKLILLYLKHHICRQSISNAVIINNQLLLKNKFFKIQTSTNPFAYMTEGCFHINNFETYKTLHYTYSNSILPVYLCLILFVLTFFWKIFGLFTLLFIIIFFLNKTIYHSKQKRFIHRKIAEFIAKDQIM